MCTNVHYKLTHTPSISLHTSYFSLVQLHHRLPPPAATVSDIMSFIISTLQYWLVKHPIIENFEWIEGKTLGSTPEFLFSTIVTYLSVTFMLYNLHLPPLKPQVLKPYSALHNAILLVLSLAMAAGCGLSLLGHFPNINYMICYPKGTPPKGPLFFWAYIFYLSKMLEFVDTLLIIVSNSIKRRLTFLHVYHHTMAVAMCFFSLHTSQSMFSSVLITNSLVHVLMYSYYLSCSLGVRPKWKRLVTDCQLLQFWSSFLIMGVIVYSHVTGPGCSGMWGWCFNAFFITSLLVLFLDFHSKNYSSSDKIKAKQMQQIKQVSL
ncbi:hypothetical protein ACFE04_022357 [Oxalis oulophora]